MLFCVGAVGPVLLLTSTMHPTYQHFEERFPGFEFDWFALDEAGRIGLFSSAGFGPVPASVQLQFQQHDRAAAHLDWRVLEMEQVCAEQGLFLFDWQHWQGPYLKLAEPIREMEAAFRQQILQIPALLVFPVSFPAVKSMQL
jgi:hypothetical protein